MTDGLVRIPGATFLMGSDRHYPEEGPAHKVTVDGFLIDAGPVTNREFGRFVRKTGYVTVAERAPDPADYPGARPEWLAPFSTVFVAPRERVSLADPYKWWQPVRGADWRHPVGPGSSIRNLPDHPVVHVAWADALAYARWMGKEIPTEAEWELAARGGLDGAEFAWGDELNPDGRWMANTWQGDFPMQNTRDDGYERTSPVGAFPANGYGLYDMIGNVWEWTSDWYAGHATDAPACCSGGPMVDAREQSIDRRDPARIPRKVMKGGSHLCAPSYCRRYRPAARMAQPVDTSTSHLGFRCVVREVLVALETFIVFAASYDTLGAAEADYHAVYDFYLTSGLLDTYDAAVITKDDAGKVRIVIKHGPPTRQGAWRGLGISLVATALDEGHSGLVVVADGDLADLGEYVIKRASRLTSQPPDQSLQEAVAESEAAVREAEREAQAAEREAEREAEAAVREAEREAEAAEREAEQYSAFGSRPAPGDDLASQLDDLARLRDKGALSQAEFEAAKARLLGG